MRLHRVLPATLLAFSALPAADVRFEQWGVDARATHGKTVLVEAVADTASWMITADLSALPDGAVIHHASLLAGRDPLDGRDDDALITVRIFSGTAAAGTPLALEPPWCDGFNATLLIREWAVRRPGTLRLFVERFPGFRPEETRLEIMYEAPENARVEEPTAVLSLRALHRHGQTFLTFGEIGDPLDGEPPRWGRMRTLLADMDNERRVRYLLFRHTAPITIRTLPQARPLARVHPLSAYNIHGRSVETLIATVRRRALTDTALARHLAQRGLDYTPDSPEMAEVLIRRFAIADRKPLPAGTGLYVHQPAAAGTAYYAVIAAVNGTAALRTIPTVAVQETVGRGTPVQQPPADVTVFYDYPGERRQYVQWTAPPLSNLPNQYYNWSVYVPREPPVPAPIRVAFTDRKFIKPGVRHRGDTILIAGQDRPRWSQWYGYHESLGTLKSFRLGIVRPYTERRLFAVLDWAVREFTGDVKRVSCVGGTEALYYGVKHGDRFAYVLADRPDPDPQQTPALVTIQSYRRRPPRPQREAAWGKVAWRIPGENGRPVWEEFNLIASVKDPTRPIAFLSMGPAMLSAPWSQQVAFMKQLWACKYGFTARFYWGGGTHLPIPEGRAGSGDSFDFALDLPFLALGNNSNDRGLDTPQFTTGIPSYGSGGRIADGRRWLADVVDEPDRFEITIHGRGRVTYAGGGTSDVTVRRAQRFKPSPGQTLRWENVPLTSGGGATPQSGRITVDKSGLVTIPQVRFENPSRLKIYMTE